MAFMMAHHAMVREIPMQSAATATADGTGGSGSGDSATISANDFLTLLVTEMKNQDPTAESDPNQYINQLVQVNSLEQLISINQNLEQALGETPKSSAASTEAAPHSLREGINGSGPQIAQAPRALPVAGAAALRVAKSLNGSHSVR